MLHHLVSVRRAELAAQGAAPVIISEPLPPDGTAGPAGSGAGAQQEQQEQEQPQRRHW